MPDISGAVRPPGAIPDIEAPGSGRGTLSGTLRDLHRFHDLPAGTRGVPSLSAEFAASTRPHGIGLGSIFAITIACSGCAGDAAVQSRRVFVNRVHLADAQVGALARSDGGVNSAIRDGAYRLNLRTGIWGYAGNPQVQGVMGHGCRQGAAGACGGQAHCGPYVTLRRAKEVANRYRAQGFRSVAFTAAMVAT
jgi:hypothetical protein